MHITEDVMRNARRSLMLASLWFTETARKAEIYPTTTHVIESP